jgi:hypothetical protein
MSRDELIREALVLAQVIATYTEDCVLSSADVDRAREIVDALTLIGIDSVSPHAPESQHV